MHFLSLAKPPMVLLSLTLTADTALLPVFFDLPGRTHWRLLQYSVTGPAVAVELPWLGAQLRSVNPGIPVAQASVVPGRLCATGPWASATACPHRSSCCSKTRWLET